MHLHGQAALRQLLCQNAQLATVTAVRLHRHHLAPLPVRQLSELTYRIAVISAQVQINLVLRRCQQLTDILYTLRFARKKVLDFAAELIIECRAEHLARPVVSQQVIRRLQLRFVPLQPRTAHRLLFLEQRQVRRYDLLLCVQLSKALQHLRPFARKGDNHEQLPAQTLLQRVIALHRKAAELLSAYKFIAGKYALHLDLIFLTPIKNLICSVPHAIEHQRLCALAHSFPNALCFFNKA